MDLGKSSTGMDANVAAGLAILFGWISGLIFFLIEKDSKFVKFYGFQGIMISLLMLPAPIPFIGWAWALLIFVLWIICIINAFSGKVFKIPVLGNIAAKQAGLE